MNSNTGGTLCIIMGGGRGTRIFPLTKHRSKPAIPFGGKYRLIDVPIANCLNSGFNKILVLTQYNSESLNKHIGRAYKLDTFSKGFVEVLAASQSYENTEWFQGTADAVRRSLVHLNDPLIREVVVLSGDQLYSMDLRDLQAFHREREADFTVACHPVPPEEVQNYGILGVDDRSRIQSFCEKPQSAAETGHDPVLMDGESRYLASMGIYMFKKDVMVKLLTESDKDDFGKEIIPDAIRARKGFAYVFKGYWADVGTIQSYYKANLMLTEKRPAFNMYDENWQFYSRARYLPPAKMENCHVSQAIIAEGCIISEGATIEDSVVGIRSRIGEKTVVRRSVLAGYDYYASASPEGQTDKREPPLGIGPDCVITNAIVDKNVRIGRNVKIVNEKKKEHVETDHYHIRDGIVIIHKGAVIPDNTVI